MIVASSRRVVLAPVCGGGPSVLSDLDLESHLSPDTLRRYQR